MIICHILPSISRNGAGVSASANNIIDSLSHMGNLVSVFSRYDDFSSVDSNFDTNIRLSLANPSLFNFSSILIFFQSMNLNVSQSNIIHSHGLWDLFNVYACFFSRHKNIPYVISPHGMLDEWALNNSKYKKTIAKFLIENKNLSKSACIHALCYSELLSARKCKLRNPVCVVPNGVDIPTASTYSLHGCVPFVAKDKKILLYLGRIHPKKGVENLLRAWNALKRSESVLASEWCLVIAGWGQDGHEELLKKYVLDSNCPDVHFIGPQFGEKKDSVFFHSDAFILPSFSEGLPMVVLEAWAHKLPVLMTPECNIPEGFAKNAALKIEASEGGILAGLQDLISMPDTLRNEIGLNGFELVKDKFTWKSVTLELQSVYEWVLGGGSPPSCVITD